MEDNWITPFVGFAWIQMAWHAVVIMNSNTNANISSVQNIVVQYFLAFNKRLSLSTYVVKSPKALKISDTK